MNSAENKELSTTVFIAKPSKYLNIMSSERYQSEDGRPAVSFSTIFPALAPAIFPAFTVHTRGISRAFNYDYSRGSDTVLL